jgi:tol-pal system protein YbgF
MRSLSTWSLVCAALLAFAGCASTPEEDPILQGKLSDLETRLVRIERVISNDSLLGLSNEMEALRADVRAMHNDIDELNHSLETSRKQQRDLYADLDQRLKALEFRGSASPGAAGAGVGGAAASVSGSGAGAPGAASANGPGADSAAYQAAFALLKDSQYDQAITAFQQFIASYPDSSLADNAQYWLGETYYVNKDYSKALASFELVVDKYPQSRKIPDAMLKIGYCDYELKQLQAAKDVLTRLTSSYPDTPAGHLAQQRLDKMAAEKH